MLSRRLNTMMQQMEVMVNGLGKKIFNNQGLEFDQLVLQQRRIKSAKLQEECQDI